MKTRVGVRTLILLAVFSMVLCSTTRAQHEADPFLGRWALYLPGGAGWLDVHQNEGYLDAELLWYGGSVLPVANAYIDDGVLTVTRQYEVVRQRDDQGAPLRTHHITNRFEFRREGDHLTGQAFFPRRNGIGLNVVSFEGKPIPALPPPPDLSKIDYAEPITLFNGRDLSGWSLINPEHENGFSVEGEVLINNPVQPEGGHHIRYGNLRTDQTFEDFNLKLQVNIPAGNNSGVYLRGIYEIQVLDSYGAPLGSHNMGALYSRITPAVAAEKPAGEWQDLDITLYRRHVTVVLNGTKIIDNQPVLGVTGGALTADEFAPGPIYLQGDHGRVLYRDIVLTPIRK